MNKSILRQIQDEMRERNWSVPELAFAVGTDRILMWKKVGTGPSAQRARVSMDDVEIQTIAQALRVRNPAFVICYPQHRRRRAA